MNDLFLEGASRLSEATREREASQDTQELLEDKRGLGNSTPCHSRALASSQSSYLVTALQPRRSN